MRKPKKLRLSGKYEIVCDLYDRHTGGIWIRQPGMHLNWAPSPLDSLSLDDLEKAAVWIANEYIPWARSHTNE